MEAADFGNRVPSAYMVGLWMRMQSPVEASSAFSFDKSGSFGYSQPSGHWGCPHQAAAAAGSGSRHACSLRLTPDIAAERAHGSGVPLWPLPTDFSSSGWLEWKFKNGIFKYIEQWYFVTKIDLIYCENEVTKKIFEITTTIYSNGERSEQFLVTKCFFNLFLEVSQI